MALAIRRRINSRRIVLLLWAAWAIIVWNVVFDHVLVVAAREYLAAALAAADRGAPYARMDDWMRPAVTRGLWLATSSAAAVLVVCLTALRFAKSRQGLPEGAQDGRPVDREGTP